MASHNSPKEVPNNTADILDAGKKIKRINVMPLKSTNRSKEFFYYTCLLGTPL